MEFTWSQLATYLAGAPAAISADWVRATVAAGKVPDMCASASAYDVPVAGSVALVPVYGAITARADLPGYASSNARIAQQVLAAAADRKVNAILLDVNSPGGSTAGMPEAAAAIRSARAAGKPIVAHVNYMAASAAYWLAAQATEIVASPSAQVGSIGVYMMHQDQSEALAKEGVKVTFIHAGKNKVLGNPAEPLSKEALAYYQEQVDEAYGEFIADVAEGRGVSEEVARGPQFGQGKVFGAKAGQEAGLVDRIATFGQTLAELSEAGPVKNNRTAIAVRRRALALSTNDWS